MTKFNEQKNKNQKPVTKTIPVVFTGTITESRKYDIESCQNILADLEGANVFSKIFIGVLMARSIYTGDESAKGSTSVARIDSYDGKNGEMKITFFGKNIRYSKFVDDNDMVIIPHVRTEKDSMDVATIMNFELVLANFSSVE